MLRFLAVFMLFGILDGAETVNFDGLKPGTAPPNWSYVATHPSAPPKWAVSPDASAPSRRNVLAQLSSDGNGSRLPIAVYDKVVCRDGDLSVKFKIVRGHEFATAGIVWRYQNPDNYYYLHFSADGKNIGFYRMRGGKSQVIPVEGGDRKYGVVGHDIRPDQWYVVRVLFRGPHVTVWFGNRRLFEADDTTLTAPGRTGVWTRGDTVAYFDDFRVRPKS